MCNADIKNYISDAISVTVKEKRYNMDIQLA
jgi:hypothetical protein